MKILRTASLGSNFTDSYIKESVFDKFFIGMQVDRLCTCGSQVIYV